MLVKMQWANNSFEGRASHFSWHRLLFHPFQTGRLFFSLMALIATMEPALAVLCSNPPDPSDTAKCCKYYTNLDSGSVNVDAVIDMAQCLSIAAPYADIIAVSPGVGCALPGQGVFNDPVPPLFASDPWVQHGVIWYWGVRGVPGVSSDKDCTGSGGAFARGFPVLLLWWGTPCTLSLTGPGGTDGALADVEPGRQGDGLRAETLCNGVPTPKDITLTLTAVDNSGGHQHVPGRPTGNLSVTGGTTPLTFAYTAPAVSGDYTITAKCVDDSCGEATGKVWVGVKGLVNIPSSGFWNLIGDTGIHPAGHYLSGDALGKLMDLAQLYTQVYFPLNTTVLQLNDASLERGGLFDIDFVGRTMFWTPPHAEHRRGVVIDIQANGTATAIPQQNFEDFEALMRRRLGMTWRPENLNRSGGHYHVRLLGIAQ